MVFENTIKYKKRIMDDVIEERLSVFPAVYIKGPKWCGKTYCSMRIANSEINLTEDSYSQLAEINPAFILRGQTPRLIDEWQECPSLWDKVKIECSKRASPAQFILSGSVNIANDKKDLIHHSGAGRIDHILLRPCSLYETGESNGTISIKDMFINPDICIGKTSELSFDDTIFALCRGGWPYQFQIQSKKHQLLLANSYIESIVNDPSSSISERLRLRSKQFLKALARNVQTFTSDDTLIEDYLSGQLASSRNEYFELKKIFISQYLLDYTLCWNSNIRSKTAIRNRPKISFVDPSIAVSVLCLKENDLKSDFNTLGYLFENLVSRDLKIYMGAINGEVYQYKDRSGLECDLVIKDDSGNYALIEVKLGSKNIEEGANNLKKINELILKAERKNRIKLKLPKFSAIITSTNFAYKRDDGIYVLPIGCLKN